MATHFITYRPNINRAEPEILDRYDDFLSWKEDGHIEGWSARKTFQPGDLVIFYMAAPLMSIVGLGVVDSDPYYEEIDDPADFKNPVFCDFEPVWFLDNRVPIKEIIKRRNLGDWWSTKPYQSIRRIETPVAKSLVEEVVIANPNLKGELQHLDLSLPDISKVVSRPKSLKKSSYVTPPKKQWKLQDLLNLSWVEFEWLVGKVFKHKNSNAKIEVTSPTADYGVDVIITKKPFSNTEVIQCKRYRPTVKVSSPDMQKFVGAMAKFKARKGYFVTTSTFNRYAIDFAEGMNVELIDGQQLVQMIAGIKGFPSPVEFVKKS